MAQMHGARHDAAHERSMTIQKATNLAGAAVSLALVVGIGVWGYKLLVRDVSGVPVVRAAEGPMRVQPDNPGGQEASHQGLSVNDVAAEGAAARPADRLVLAPEPLDLTLEDAPAAAEDADEPQMADATPQAEAADAPADTGEETLQLAAIEALAAGLAEGVEPLSEQPEAEAEPEVTPEPAATRAEGGLGRSLRPKQRPASISSVEEAVAAAVAAAVADQPEGIDPAAIPAGTRMAQLGAFESAEIAEQEWGVLSDRFSEYLEDKQRVIQKAQSGGRTFYRLRALGFSDLSEARRFCSALVAEKAECIPVVTR